MSREGGKRTVCPFYEKESGYRIVCEGLYEDTKFSLLFPKEEAKERWQKAICYSFEKYKICPFVRILESEKYK